MSLFGRLFQSVCVLLILSACQSTRTIRNELPSATKASSSLKVELSDEVILPHKFFTVSYNRKFQLPNWVAYKLQAEKLRIVAAKRGDKFIYDPLLLKVGVIGLQPDSLKKTGIQRGHMAPSADFLWDQEANDATFMMSNMAPQLPELNGIAWNALERRVRRWACFEGDLYVVTGPLFSTDDFILPNGTRVPARFFKAILDTTEPIKAIGFIYNQTDGHDVFRDRAVTIDYIEDLAGIEMFGHLPKEVQDDIEAKFDLAAWNESDCIASGNLKATKPSVALCRAGDLRNANISGCCSRHGGVMGPKSGYACCTKEMQVICNDLSVSASCACD